MIEKHSREVIEISIVAREIKEELQFEKNSREIRKHCQNKPGPTAYHALYTKSRRNRNLLFIGCVRNRRGIGV